MHFRADRTLPESGSVRRIHRVRDGGGGGVGDEIPGQAGNDESRARNTGVGLGGVGDGVDSAAGFNEPYGMVGAGGSIGR